MSSVKMRQSVLEMKRQQRKRRRTYLTVLGCMVVLATAFALMVPAISITQENATQDEGFYQDNHQSVDAVEAPSSSADGEAQSYAVVNNGGSDSAFETISDASTDPSSTEIAGSGGEAENTSVLNSEGGEGPSEGAADAAEEAASASARDEEPADEIGASGMPAQKLEGKIVDENGASVVTVDVEAPEGALPKGATMTVEEVADERVLSAAKEKGAEDSSIEAEHAGVVAVNITFFDSDGEEVEPAKDVRVTMGARAVQEAVRESKADGALAVVHLDDKRLAELAGVEKLADIDDDHVVEVEDAKAAADVVDDKKVDVNRSQENVTFEAAKFSVYAIVYTVDFHYEVDGKTYEYSIPGGGFISFYNLVETLGIEANDANTEKDEIQDLLDDVESVTFSNSDLVTVNKVEENTTVGAIKERLGLECEYSAELTEEQIAEINAQTVEAGDWALICKQSFNTEESLTVTMRNGDQFVVKVTDAQISTHVITADGEDYVVTVTYGPEAGIPDGATLEAEEILEGTNEYEDMLNQSKAALSKDDNRDAKILFLRFFDISIHDADGSELEPLSPVAVTVQYDNPIEMTDAKPSVVHFAEDGIEVIHPETRLIGDGKEGVINVFEYEQGSFSGIGTIVEADSLEDGQYFMVVGDNGDYYAMKNDGSLSSVTYYHQTKQVEAAPGTNENDLLWNVSGVGHGYYTFKAANGDNYLTLQNGSVVGGSSTNVLVQHNSWDESQNETGGYYIYHAPNAWDSNTWNPLRMGYWDNASHFYVGDKGSSPQRIRLYKYAVSSSSGEPPATNTYTGIEVNPSELDEWLMSLFDDMPVGNDGYHKTAEVYDYENRIYQIDFTALSNAQGFASDIDIAFSVDMSNSMLFPSTMTTIGTIELKQSVLESTLDKEQVYFVISDVKGTATVNALFYDKGGRGEWHDGQYYTVPAGWRYEDASKYARGQRKAAHQTDSAANLDKLVGDNNGFKIQGTDTGFYTLYKADAGYLNYINSGQSVYDNPYNRLADMKESLRMAFNFLDVMREKYHCKVRVGWNGFAKDVVDGNNYDYRCYQNNHTLKDLSQVDYRTILNGITQAGNQTGGGTRPDKAFIDAANMGWGSNTQKYLVLITDGAPQGGGASSAAAALAEGQKEGKNLTDTKGVNIVSIGLSTEHVDGAASLFEDISCKDPNPGSDQQMIYQAKDGDALKNAVVDALRVMVSKAITVGTIKDTIDSAFYPVSIDGTPLKSGDKIDLNGKLTTDTSKPYGAIGWDAVNRCWTVEWKEQDFVWPDEEHPHGWHGRVLVKAKENFLGGNDISTNKGQASLDVIKAKVPVKNADGTWRFQDTPFQSLMNVTNEQLQTRYMDTPHVNVDELEMTKNDTEWTVYLDTQVDPEEQMKALFNEIKVMKVVTNGDHEMNVHNAETARDVMVYDLVPTEDGNYSYELASSDARDKRNVDQSFFYLKDLFNMKDSLNNDFIIDDMTAEQAITKLLNGEKVEVKYQGYGHGTTDKPVGNIILELKADPNAQINNLNEHNTSKVGNAVEKYILSAEYKPTPEEAHPDWYWNTGSFGTKDRGFSAEDKTKYNNHTINVIKRILTINKVDSNGNTITDADAGEAKFEIYQKDGSGSKINSRTVTTSGLSYIWDYVVPDEDQKIPKEYWKDATTYYIKEVEAPKGYAAFGDEITVVLSIGDNASSIPNNGDNEVVPYNWSQTASLGASGDADYVTVTGSPDIAIAVKNDKSVDITVIKTDTENVEIPGAKFTITRNSALQTDIRVIKKDGSWDTEADRITVENGVFTIPVGGVTILGLRAGEYTLTEIEPPAGYLKTLQPITFTAGRDGTVTYTNDYVNKEPDVKPADSNKQYTVQNEAGTPLPNAGGSGALQMYLIGIVLTGIACASLTKGLRRRNVS